MAEMNSTNFIRSDPTQTPYYCVQCQVACDPHTWESHLNEKKNRKSLNELQIQNRKNIFIKAP